MKQEKGGWEHVPNATNSRDKYRMLITTSDFLEPLAVKTLLPGNDHQKEKPFIILGLNSTGI